MTQLSEEITKQKTARIWNNALRYAMIPVYDTAKQTLEANSVSSGQFKDALYISVHRPTSRDRAAASFMGESYIGRVSVNNKRRESIIHERKYTTKKGKTITKKTVAFQKSNRPIALALEFGTAKMQSEPFLYDALMAHSVDIQQRLGRVLWLELSAGKYAKQAGFKFGG